MLRFDGDNERWRLVRRRGRSAACLVRVLLDAHVAVLVGALRLADALHERGGSFFVSACSRVTVRCLPIPRVAYSHSCWSNPAERNVGRSKKHNNAPFFIGVGGAVVAGGVAIGIGCAEPTPAEPLTRAGGAPTIAGGTLLMYQGVNFFRTVTLPATKNWGCD